MTDHVLAMQGKLMQLDKEERRAMGHMDLWFMHCTKNRGSILNSLEDAEAWEQGIHGRKMLYLGGGIGKWRRRREKFWVWKRCAWAEQEHQRRSRGALSGLGVSIVPGIGCLRWREFSKESEQFYFWGKEVLQGSRHSGTSARIPPNLAT